MNWVLYTKKAKSLRSVLHQRENGLCFWCDQSTSFKKGTVDHIIPKSQGGPLTEENAVYSCVPCNQKRGDKDAFLYLAETAHLRNKETLKHE